MNNTLDLVRFITLLVLISGERLEEIDKSIKIDRSTHKPSKRNEKSELLAYVRLGGTQIINPNVYCGMLRHTIIIDLYSAKTDPKNVEEVFEFMTKIVEDFPNWGDYIRKAGGNANYKGSQLDCRKMELRLPKNKDSEAYKKCFGENDLKELSPEVAEDKIKKLPKDGPYELASSFLENSGLYSMQEFNGVGIELSFEVDEKVGASC